MAEPAPENVLEIANTQVAVGERTFVNLPLGSLPTQTDLAMRLEIIRGVKPGPTVFISAAIHGDELNGAEIVRRVLPKLRPKYMSGTVIAVPIVNVHGFIQQSRYLPDRRDLNRSFPGSKRGSLASRMANLFLTSVVSKCDFGIDLHTAAKGRYNLPQIRADLEVLELSKAANAFCAPVTLNTTGPKGSLRRASAALDIPVLLYEGGEASRFDIEAIDFGVAGVLRVMQSLGVIKTAPIKPESPTVHGIDSKWVRAKRSGLLRLDFSTGAHVTKSQKIGVIGDAFGDRIFRITSPCDGIIISHATNPLLNQGDPIVHIATT